MLLGYSWYAASLDENAEAHVAYVAMWLAVPPLSSGFHAPVKLAQAQIGRNGPIVKALENYRYDMERYPEPASLFNLPSGLAVDQYRGPNMEPPFEGLVAPWGNALVYCAPGKINKDGYDLYSIGPDGVDDGGREGSNDVKNWVEKQTRRYARFLSGGARPT